MTLTDVLIDFSMLSVLLVIGAWLRRKIKFLQIYYIPVSLIAGILGLLLGPQILGKISPVCFTFSSSIGQWAGILSAIVFSCSFLGLKLEKVSGEAMQTYFLAGTIHQLQIIVGLSVTFLLGLVFADLKFGFGILPVLGYYGGHSMAIAGGTIFDDAGYMTSGAQVGATFATIGLLTGVIWGMIEINRAAQKGTTKVKMRREEMPESMLTGFYPEGERPSLGNSVTASAAIDPLGSQVMLVGFIILCGHILRTGLIKVNPFFKNLPLFACCLIFSAIFCIATQKVKKVNDMIDRKTVVRISGSALEYMIAAALATTSISVFTTYAVPLIVVGATVAIVTHFACFTISKWVLPKDDCFETSVGLFGQCCGVLATGLLLLKVVDPDFQTNAATNITSSSTLGYTYQLQYTLIFIALLMTKPMFVYLWSWGLMLLLLGAGIFFGKKYRKPAV